MSPNDECDLDDLPIAQVSPNDECGCERDEDHGSCAACSYAGCWVGDGDGTINRILGWCQCDTPEETDRMVLAYLRTMRTDAFPRSQPEGVSEDAWMLLRYLADRQGWTEHGGTVGGAWLTDAGWAMLARLERAA